MATPIVLATNSAARCGAAGPPSFAASGSMKSRKQCARSASLARGLVKRPYENLQAFVLAWRQIAPGEGRAERLAVGRYQLGRRRRGDHGGEELVLRAEGAMNERYVEADIGRDIPQPDLFIGRAREARDRRRQYSLLRGLRGPFARFFLSHRQFSPPLRSTRLFDRRLRSMLVERSRPLKLGRPRKPFWSKGIVNGG